MIEIIKKKIEDKKDNLLKIYQGLKKLQRLKLNELKENLENLWAVSFGLVAGIEAMLDISQYILAEKKVKIESYGKIPEKLYEKKIIDGQFRDKMIRMIGFRNRAIHNYPSLDEEQIYHILKIDINDFKEFLKIMEKYSKKEK